MTEFPSQPGQVPSFGPPPSAIQPTAPPTRSKRTMVLAGAVAAALLLAGGTYVVARQLGGGGKQPADVLPGESLLYVRMDLDPSAGQKIAAFRLLDKMPEAKKALTDQNPKKALFDLLAKNSNDLKSIDYTNDIEPWLGDRAGMAMLAPSTAGGQPVPVLALAVKDEAKANAGLDKLQQAGKNAITDIQSKATLPAGPGSWPSPTPSAELTWEPSPSPSPSPSKSASADMTRFYRDGYMVFTTKSEEQAVRHALDRGVLSNRPEYTDDMAAVGDPGIISAWIDTPRFMDVAMKTSQSGSVPAATEELLKLATRQSVAVRFTPDALEAVSFTRGNAMNLPNSPLQDIATLPGDTAGLLSFSDGDVILKQFWDRLRQISGSSMADIDRQLADWERSSGIKLPDDLQTLFGKQFDLVVSEKMMDAEKKVPQIGVRMRTDTAKAEAILTKVKALMSGSSGQAPQLPQTTKDGRVYLALNQSYLDDLSRPGSLGDTVNAAVPDLGKSTMVLWINLDKLEQYYIDTVPADQREAVRALKGIAVSSAPVKDGVMSTARLLAN